MLIERILKDLVLFRILIAVSLMFFHATYTDAGTVVVKPGQFDHFTLQIPERPVAGENVIVRVQAYDANNNLITNFSETGKEFKVDIQGSATANPSTLSASSFSGGSANISISGKKAEKFLFSLKESGGTVAVISRELLILPNKLDHFVLQAPAKTTAGVPFDVRIIAKDLFENTVDDLNVGRNIKFNTTGTSSVKMFGASSVDFKNGMATAGFLSEKVGNLLIELQEISTGSRGRTQEIIVFPAALSYFKMQAPKTVAAGDAFELLITAYDSYDNVVENYSSVGAGVRLSTSGTSKLETSFVNQTEFKNGQAVVKETYEKAEDIQIVAKENNREQSGKTSDIQITNTAPDHFVVITPDSAVSGQKFKIKIESYDRFNNLAKNFNLAGNGVVLSVSGSGTITPASVLPSEFINGIAMIEVMYDKAESFQISAHMATERAPGKITVKEQEVKREVSHAREASRSPEKKPAAFKSVTETVASKQAVDKKEPRKEPPPKKVVQTVKEASPKKKAEPKVVKESKKPERGSTDAKAEEPKQKSETVKKAELKKEPAQESSAADVTKKSVLSAKEITAKPPQVAKQEAVKKKTEISPSKQAEHVKREAKAEKKEDKEEKKSLQEPKQPIIELAKHDEKKVEKPSVPHMFSVSNVSIIEAKNKAMLVINITNPNGHLEYSDVIESRYGKDWLKLKIKPAVRKSDKLYKFKSAFIGDVMVEEDKSEQDTLDVFIEMIPAGVTFDIARIKNTLVVTLSQP